MGARERIGKLFRLFLLFTVLVAVALISAITTIRVTIRGHQETMPNLVGVPLDSAQRISAALGLDLKVEDKLFSAQVPANRIISQVPPPSTRIKMGQHIHVVVSLGPPRIAVPNLIGSSLRAARIVALQRGLTMGELAAVHWPGTEANQVVAQDPPPSTAEVHSPSVNFLVSLGDIPAAFVCPSFVGQPLAEVRPSLEKAGFKVDQLTPIPTEDKPKGTILTQSPPPGSRIGPDTVFSFQVAQ